MGQADTSISSGNQRQLQVCRAANFPGRNATTFLQFQKDYHSVKRDIDVLCYVFVKAKYEDMSSLDRQHPLH